MKQKLLSRRQAIKAFGAGVAGTALLTQSQRGAAQNRGADNWPQFGYDAANTGYIAEAELPHSEVKEVWRFQANGAVRTSPVVVENTIFFGANDGNLYAVNKFTGEQRWEFGSAQRNFNWSPAIHDGTVFAGSSNGTLYAANTQTGNLKWKFNARGAINSAPTVFDETVYIGSTGPYFYAIASKTGDLRWKNSIDPKNSCAAVIDDLVFVPRRDDSVDGVSPRHLYALNSETGEKVWSFSGNFDSPTYSNGIIYAPGRQDGLYAIDAKTGNRQWLFEPNGNLRHANPAVANKIVFIGDIGKRSNDGVTIKRGNLYGIDAETGEQLWEYNTIDKIVSSPAVTNNVVVAVSGKIVFGVDPETGEQLWRFQTDGRIITNPIIVEDMVVVGDKLGHLYAIAGPETTFTHPETDPSSVTTQIDRGKAGQSPEEGGESITDSVPGNSSNNSLEMPQGTEFAAAAAIGGGLMYTAIRYQNRTGSEVSETDEKAQDFNDSGSMSARLVEAPPRQGQPPEQIPVEPDLDLTYDSFDRKQLIGKGGNADVYRAIATNHPDQPTVALKEPRFEGTLHQETVDRFQREAETWERLDDHDHIVGVIDWKTEPLPWIAMEYMDAGDLSAQSGDLSFPQAVWTAGRIADGVRHAHEHGVIHLDIKPSNILLRDAGEDYWDVPKIGDWGLAKLLLDHSKSVEELSPEYAAPEQFDPEEFGGTDKRTDIYQLGSIFYELFVGEPAFKGSAASVLRAKMDGQITAPSRANPALPATLDDVLLDAMAVEKADRYDSVTVFRNELRQLLREL
jgi:outer membrane protein assembly factor BamB/tRNA A-37 threonylcarbamoyl transferase component Bud32